MPPLHFFLKINGDAFVKSRILQNGIMKYQRLMMPKDPDFGLFTSLSMVTILQNPIQVVK